MSLLENHVGLEQDKGHTWFNRTSLAIPSLPARLMSFWLFVVIYRHKLFDGFKLQFDRDTESAKVLFKGERMCVLQPVMEVMSRLEGACSLAARGQGDGIHRQALKYVGHMKLQVALSVCNWGSGYGRNVMEREPGVTATV